MENDKANWEFFLFVSKKNPKTEYEIKLLRKICEEHLYGRYSIEVIDVILDPETTIKENIIATPALLKKFPAPSRRIIGDLSDERKLLAALDILPEEVMILLIDDDNSIQNLFSKILKRHGYLVSTADSGHEGLKLLEKNAYQLIFLDLNMPGMSGIETLREIRKKDTGIPVYIITAFEDAYFEELKDIREEGIEFELLHKPLEKDELVNLVDRLLKK